MELACFTFFGDSSEAFWTMMSFFAILVSFLFIIRQIKLQNSANEINFIDSFEKKWWSKEFVELRSEICLKQNNAIDYKTERILGFFEDLGLMCKKNVISKELVWEKFSFYIENYWIILKPCVKEYQCFKSDPTWYCNFDYLQHFTFKYSKKRTTNKDYKISKKDRKKFKSEESKLKYNNCA